MKVLNVIYKCKPGKRAAFLEALEDSGLAAACRAEAGNIKYDYYFAAADENELALIEKWKDQEAFDSHCAEDHFKKIGEMKDDYVEDTQLEIFDV